MLPTDIEAPVKPTNCVTVFSPYRVTDLGNIQYVDFEAIEMCLKCTCNVNTQGNGFANKRDVGMNLLHLLLSDCYKLKKKNTEKTLFKSRRVFI